MFKYAVTSNVGIDISDIDVDLTSPNGNETIPARSVEINHDCNISKRVSYFYMTHEEAEKLKQDERVLDVELSLEERDDVQIVLGASQSGNFDRTPLLTNDDYVSWSLKRHTTQDTTQPSDDISSYNYSYAGESVDLVFIDTGIEADHPEFLDANGNSRVKKVNWLDIYKETNPNYVPAQTVIDAHKTENYYQEQNSNHGTSSASVAAGNLYGFAKKANIYSIKVSSTGGTYYTLQFGQFLNAILHWHNNKNTDNPTVLSASIGFKHANNFSLSNVSGGYYSDGNTSGTWTRGSETNEQIATTYKIKGSTARPFLNTYYQALIEELEDAGVHAVFGSGNEQARIVKPDHPEYDNYVTDNGVRWFYNRAGTPFAYKGFNVGAVTSSVNAQDEEQLASFTNRGQGVDIYAAGNNVIAAASNYDTNYSNFQPYEGSSTYKKRLYSGTSCAAPVTAGVVAVYAGVRRHYSPEKLKQAILNDATSVIYENPVGYAFTGSNFSTTFLDSNNKFLFNKYNQDVGLSINNLDAKNAIVGKSSKGHFIYTAENYYGDDAAGFYPFSRFQTKTIIENDVTSIYPEGTIKGFWRRIKTNKFYLQFDGSGIYNGGWESLVYHRTARTVRGKTTYHSLRLHRKDATYNPYSREFVWDNVQTTQEDTPREGKLIALHTKDNELATVKLF